MSDAHANDATDAAPDPLDAELRSLMAEHRLDEILASIPSGNPTFSAGITLRFDSTEEDEDEEPETLRRDLNGLTATATPR